MKLLMLVAVFLIGTVLFAQVPPTKPKVYIHPGLGFYRLTDDPWSIHNTPLLLDFKVGMSVGKHGALGFQFSSAFQSEQVSGRSNIQQPGSGTVWTKSGKHTIHTAGMGIFYERFFQMGKRFTFFPSAYMQFFFSKNIEEGGVYTGTESTPSITYKREVLHNYKVRLGVNLNMQYALSASTAITLRFAQTEGRFSYKFNPQVYFELPVLVGVKYEFK